MTDQLRQQLQQSLGTSYVLDRELGGGGMSRTFVARDTSLGREVVVKVLPPEMAAGVSIERFKREIALAARLQHPHIVPLFSASQVDGLPYFTMPFVEGESLRARIAKTGELPINEAVRVLREVASALDYAHEKGVVHRDIKPDNVLLSRGSAMVTDFGVAKALSASSNAEHSGMTSLGVALGTPAYMSPEQASADPQTDHRADIYAFGVLAYELLTGQPPFAGRTPQGLLAAHVTEQPEMIARRRANIPPALAALVMRCLEKRAADRPQNAHEIVHALDAMTTPSGGSEPTTAQPAVGPATPTRSFLPWIAAGALLAVALAAVVLWRRGAKTIAPDKGATHRVAVATFQNKSGDQSLEPIGDMAADWIARGLAGTGIVDVAGTAAELKARADVNVGGGASGIEQLGREARADIVISGAYYKQGDSLFLQADFNDVRQHKLLQSVGPVAALVARPLDGIEVLRRRVTGALAPILDSTLAGAAEVVERPPSYEAYRELLRAEELFYSDERAADQAYARTLALDSTYSYPLLRYISLVTNEGRLAAADSLIRIAQTRRGRLSPYENAYLDFLSSVLGGTADEVLHATERMRALAPNAAFPKYVDANSLIRAGFPRHALALLDSLDPTSGELRGRVYYYAYRVDAQHALGDYEGAVASALRGRAQYPSDVASLNYLTEAETFGGHTDKAIALLDSLLALPSGRLRSTPHAFAITALYEARAHDHPDTERAIAAWVEAHLTQGTRREDQLARLTALGALERWERVGPLADSLLVGDVNAANADPALWRGFAAAKAGDRKTADRMARRVDSLISIASADTTGSAVRERDNLLLQRATLTAALGDLPGAMTFIQQVRGSRRATASPHQGPLYSLMRGYPPYQALLKPRD